MRSTLTFALHTFVFILSGADDHVVPKNHAVVGDFFDSVESDYRKLFELREQVKGANVVGLYLSRTGTTLFCYNDEFFHEERVPALASDPDVIENALRFAKTWFPDTDLHLIYRGHGIDPDQIGSFRDNLERAQLEGALKSVVFAACSMAYLEIASAIAPFAEHMIASQVDIVETEQAGFDYAFLSRVNDSMTPTQVAELIASTLLASFANPPYVVEKQMEQPVTLIDLQSGRICFNGFCVWLDKLAAKYPDVLAGEIPGVVQKQISNLYVEHLRQQGKKSPQIRRFVEAVHSPASNPRQWDVLTFLTGLLARLAGPEKEECETLARDFPSALKVFNPCAQSSKCGLSFLL